MTEAANLLRAQSRSQESPLDPPTPCSARCNRQLPFLGSSTVTRGRKRPCEIRVSDSEPGSRIFHAQRHRHLPFAVITAPSPVTVSHVPCSVARRPGTYHQLLLPPEQLPPPEQIPPEQPHRSRYHRSRYHRSSHTGAATTGAATPRSSYLDPSDSGHWIGNVAEWRTWRTFPTSRTCAKRRVRLGGFIARFV